MSNDIIVVVDISNILYPNEDGQAKLKNFHLVKEALKKRVPTASIISLADANTRHRVDAKAEYERLIKEGQIVQTPAGEQADHYILKFASTKDRCVVISCDRYQEYHVPEDLRQRVVPVLIVAGEVIFSPKLDKFLDQIDKPSDGKQPIKWAACA